MNEAVQIAEIHSKGVPRSDDRRHPRQPRRVQHKSRVHLEGCQERDQIGVGGTRTQRCAGWVSMSLFSGSSCRGEPVRELLPLMLTHASRMNK